MSETPLERMAKAADAMTEADRAHYLEDEDAPATPTGAAPDASPEPPADPATPSPSTPGESSAAGTCEDMCAGISEMSGRLRPFAGGEAQSAGAMTVNWFAPKVGRARLSGVAVLAALEDMDADERERTLQFAVSAWWLADVKGAGY